MIQGGYMNERKSNFELLRIISILMIITIHYFLYMMNGDFNNLSNFQQYKNYYLVKILESFFIIGVNLFALITGYFMIKKESVNIKRIIKLVFNTSFYGIIIFIILFKWGYVKISIKEIVKAIGSTLTYTEYWFIKSYVILFCIIPFINILLNQINKETYKYLILIITFLFSLCNSFLPIPFYSSCGYDVVHLIYMYCIGGYIRLHFETNKRNIWLLGYLGFALITFVMSLYPYPSIFNIWGYNYIFNVLSSICLFIYFTKLQIQSKIINIFSKSVFGIYLIHINHFVSPIIYKGVAIYWNSNVFIPNLIFRVIGIFIVCSIIELLKEFIFSKTIYKLIDKFKVCNIEIGKID